MSLGFTFIAQHTCNIIYLHSVGGYDCAFVDVPHHDDYCVICLHPARDPQQTKCECAKLYCKSCYDQLKSASGTCPTCRQPLDAFPDRNSARRVKGMRVKCTSAGCLWVNELGSLESHLETCGFALIPCANGCKELIMRSEHTSHCTEVCPLRSHTCEHCKSKGTYKEMTGGHLDECPDLMIPCPNNGCGDSIKRKQIVSHHLECPFKTIDCPYKDVGCTYTSPRRTMEDHKVTSCGYHLDLAMVKLKILDRIATSRGHDLNQGMVKLEDLDRKANSREQELYRAMVQIINLNHKATSCEDDLKVAMVKLGQFYAQNPCVIKMPGFNQTNTAVWHSPGFYTHPCGYKMCLIVYANGDGADKGTHVSVYLHLMKGENDDTLTWPIRYKCTITLLNQLRDDSHHSKTWTYSSVGADVHNSRVLGGESGGGIGYTKFIPRDQLGFQKDKQCQYMKDDSLYFRVQVEVLPACNPWLIVTVPN